MKFAQFRHTARRRANALLKFFLRLARNQLSVQVGIAFLMLAVLLLFIQANSVVDFKKRFGETYVSQLDGRLHFIQETIGSSQGVASILNHPTRERHALSHPYVLNVSAVDVNDPRKAIDTATQAGCSIELQDVAETCFGIGDNQTVGAYLYVTGWFIRSPLIPHEQGTQPETGDRFLLSITVRGVTRNWIALFQGIGGHATPATQKSAPKKLLVTGYRLDDALHLNPGGHDDKDFFGTIVSQERTASCEDPSCKGKWLFAFKAPLDEYRDDVSTPGKDWPPADLGESNVHLKLLPAAGDTPISAAIFDTDDPRWRSKFSLDAKLQDQLWPGERLIVLKASDTKRTPLWEIASVKDPLPHNRFLERIAFTLAPYVPGRLTLAGKNVAAVESQKSTFQVELVPSPSLLNDGVTPAVVQAMKVVPEVLFFLFVCWLFLQRRIIQRINRLTARIEPASSSAAADDAPTNIDFSDFKTFDELGTLASSFDLLLRRIHNAYTSKQRMLEIDRVMWTTIGHEIRSPLQSLSSIHKEETDPSRKHVQRMLTTVEILYGLSSVQSEWTKRTIDVDNYMRLLSDNAKAAGLPSIEYTGPNAPAIIKADETRFDSIVDNIIINAARYCPLDEPIKVAVSVVDGLVAIAIFNNGKHIPEKLLERIFDFGVSEAREEGDLQHKGVGLFVAQYHAKVMDGLIVPRNVVPTGVEFTIRFPLVPSKQ